MVRTPLRPPTPKRLCELAETHYLDLDDEEVTAFRELIAESLGTYERIDELVDERERARHTTRDPGYRPGPDEDPLNAFVTKCCVDGAEDGPLSGYDVGLKDNIAVGGVEMTCGSRVFDGFVPERDATAVTRVLDAGGTVVGKTNMSDMAVSGTGELTATGPVRNPRDREHLSGGSSSGSAAAVVAGDVDVALSTDQAGSIRVPAAWSGCVGHKPTHGLVPYTGAVGMGYNFDHLGPIARSVADCALALDAIAGEDPRDPRQADVRTEEYTAALEDGAEDLTVGLLEEGFSGHEPAVDRTVRGAVEAFEDAGATVEEVSIPWHEDGAVVWRGIVPESIAAITRGDGVGHFVDGAYDTQLLQGFATAKRARADEFPPTYKFLLLLGQYLMDEHYGYYHAKAQNLACELREAYDDALDEVDVLALPTSPITAYEVDESTRGPKELVERAQTGVRTLHSSPFDVTGHPACSVPAGDVDGLPVGLMLVGRHFEDATVLRAGHNFEGAINWSP